MDYIAALIPVPVKGTIISQKNTHLLYIFNPRTREEYDISSIIRISVLYSFNPRTHEGYDGKM